MAGVYCSPSARGGRRTFAPHKDRLQVHLTKVEGRYGNRAARFCTSLHRVRAFTAKECIRCATTHKLRHCWSRAGLGSRRLIGDEYTAANRLTTSPQLASTCVARPAWPLASRNADGSQMKLARVRQRALRCRSTRRRLPDVRHKKCHAESARDNRNGNNGSRAMVSRKRSPARRSGR